VSAEDRRALTELLVDKIVVGPHPRKIDKDGRRHYLIRAIPYQDPLQEAERLNAEGNSLMSTLGPSIDGHQDLAKESQRIDHNGAVVRVGQMGLMRSV
jgi:hypothetical protein